LKKRNSFSFCAILFFLVIPFTSPVSGEEVFLSSFSGSIRGGYWSNSRSLDDQEDLKTASFWLKTTPKIASLASAHLEAWIINQELFGRNETKGMLREGFVDLTAGPVDFRLGKQIIVWGRADQINPTDNLSPRDYTLLFPDDNEQRFGSLGLRASTVISTLSIQGFWLPYFKPNLLPIVQPAPPLTLHEEEPENAYGQWGLKFEMTRSVGDGSISYYDGFDLNPDFALQTIFIASNQLPLLNVVLSHHRIRTFGMDGAVTVGRFGIRGEAAYTLTENSGDWKPFIKSPFFFVVLGGDRTFLEYFNVNLQYILREVSNYHDPENIPDPLTRSIAIQEALFNNQLDQISQGVSLRVCDKWLNETLEAELAGIYIFTRHDYLLRPKITYALTDSWKLLVAADFFRGSDVTYFGYLRNNSTSYTELSYHF
jgi:hypothetical protein